MISLLVINYRASALARNAIRTARASSPAGLQVVVVDNSCDVREAEALRDAADVLLTPDANRGYAGGINLGRRSCEGDVIVISNPDVTFAEGCLDRLAAALSGSTVAAGPALFWDDAFRWHLPPGDLLTAPEKLDQIFASRSRAWREQRDRRRFLQRVAFWSLQRTTRVRMLSGAVLAVRASELDEAGGFDERFALYFEETDFLRRLGQRRKRIVHVPEARCRHLFNQSAAQTAGEASARYAESERKYLEKWNGPWLAQVLKSAEGPMPAMSLSHSGEAAGEVVTEASPLASFETAAGFFGPAETVPPEVRASLGGSALYLRQVERGSGKVVKSTRLN